MERRVLEQEDYVCPHDFLPDALPENVCLILPFRENAASAFKARVKELVEGGAKHHKLDLQTPAYQQFLAAELNKTDYFQQNPGAVQPTLERTRSVLFHAQIAGEAINGGLLNVDSLPPMEESESSTRVLLDSLFSAWLKLGGESHLFRDQVLQLYLTLCAAFEPIPLDDLDQWGVLPQTYLDALELVPSTLLFEQRSLFPSLGLGHESMREFFMNSYKEQFGMVCRKLCGWVVHQIDSMGELKLEAEQGREWARLAFSRLYRWALLSGESDVLEWVVRNKDLQKKRIAVAQALEKTGRVHQKVAFLDLWVEALYAMVETYMATDLRDEWAWALSSRGLTYLSISRKERALQDIDKSVQIFEELVKIERQTQFRNGLAAAYNRRSELLFTLGNFQAAHRDAAQAVEIFAMLVSDLGRDELRPLLALAHHNQATICVALKNPREALAAGLEALKVYQQLIRGYGAEERKYRPDQARSHALVARIRFELKETEAASTDATRAVQILQDLVENDKLDELRPDLASACDLRAQCYLARDQKDLAAKDYTKAIQIYNQLLDEGRLDLRDDIAKTYMERARLQLASKEPREALRDVSKALEMQVRLLDEGRQDQAPLYARNLLLRAQLYRDEEQFDQAMGDYGKAIQALEVPKSEDASNRQIAEVYLGRCSCNLQRGRYHECAADSERVVELADVDKTDWDWDVEDRFLMQAQGLALRGEAERKALKLAPARDALQKSNEILYRLVHQEHKVELLGELASCYSNLGQVSLLQERLESALQETTRAIDVLQMLVEQNSTDFNVQGALAQALSCRGEAQRRLQAFPQATSDLNKAVEIFSTLVEGRRLESFADGFGLAQRRQAQLLCDTGAVPAAVKAIEQSNQVYQKLWTKDRKGPWLDEICRTSRVRSGISMAMKEFAGSEEEVTRALEHFSALVHDGKLEYVDDLILCYLQRGSNFQRAANQARAAEEYGKQAQVCRTLMESHPDLDLRSPLALASYKQAVLSAEQKVYEQAYNSFEQAIQVYRHMVLDENRLEFGRSLGDCYADRGKMLLEAGHLQNAVEDLTQAAQLLTILVNQGHQELRRRLSQAAAMRAAAYQKQGDQAAALEDLNIAISLALALTNTETSQELFTELARALSQRGRLWLQMQQNAQAADDFANAVQIYTRLVDTQGRNDLSPELAECLLVHLSLSSRPDDPSNQASLVRAVKLVLQQVKEGRPPQEGFVVDGLRTVDAMLNQDPKLSESELSESVLRLVEAVVINPRMPQDWVQITELLTSCASKLDPQRSPKYVHLITLACATCQREVTALGPASLGRLVYFLHQLGLLMDRARPPECIGVIGNCFTLIGENLRNFTDPTLHANLREMITAWRNLPPSMPAVANVSRQMLTQLARSL